MEEAFHVYRYLKIIVIAEGCRMNDQPQWRGVSNDGGKTSACLHSIIVW